MAQTSSRLEALQARFQQKQMQEKEQKLLQLYDQQQQRAYQVIQKGSAGSTGSVSQLHSVMRTTTSTHTTSSSQGGKVRQMFDERRQTTVKGIDRSYPLEPLENMHMRQIVASHGYVSSELQHRNKNGVEQTVNVRRAVRSDINSNQDGEHQIITYPEEVTQVSFGTDNRNGKYHDVGCDRSLNQNEVHIEEIFNDDTIDRNRMLAKIHLMEYDANLRHRIDNDLNSEKFPDELMVNIPDKLPKKRITKKLSAAEARLERFKHANTKSSNAVVTTAANRSKLRERSDPLFATAKSNTRDSTINSKRTDVEKMRQSAIERLPSPAPMRSPKITAHRVSTPADVKAVKLHSPRIPLELVHAKTTAKPVRSGNQQLAQPIQPVIESSESSSTLKKRQSLDPVDEKFLNPTAKTTTRRSCPASPTNSGDIATRHTFSSPKSRTPPVTKSSKRTTKSHGKSRDITSTTSPRAASEEVNADGTSCRSEPEPRADDTKCSASSPTARKIDVKSSVLNDDKNSKKKGSAEITEPTLTEAHTKWPSTSQNRKQSSATSSSSSRSPSVPLSASSKTTSARDTSSAESQSRPMASEQKNPTRSPGMTASTKGSPSLRNSPKVLSSDTLVACKTCGRRFAEDRVPLHEKICAKTKQKKRKQFNTVLHRVQGTELEAFAPKDVSTGRQAERRVKKPEVKPKSNWRRKHEDFINAIRSAKQVQAHLAAGGKLSDLPPPPASDTSDYIQCPHCGRKFNQGAAERHIPKCATMMHNKPRARAPPKPKR